MKAVGVDLEIPVDLETNVTKPLKHLTLLIRLDGKKKK